MKIIIYRRSSLIGTHGGVEKVVSSLANAFTQDGHQVMIMTRDKRKGKLFYPVNEKVQFVNVFSCIKKKLNPLRTILYKLALTSKYYKKWFEIFPYCDRNLTISKIIAPQIKEFNPDIILSCGITDTVDLCYKQHIDTPIIQMFHSLPTVYFKIKNPHHKQIIFDCLQKTTVAQVLCPSFVENLRPYYSHDIRLYILVQNIKISITIMTQYRSYSDTNRFGITVVDSKNNIHLSSFDLKKRNNIKQIPGGFTVLSLN